MTYFWSSSSPHLHFSQIYFEMWIWLEFRTRRTDERRTYNRLCAAVAYLESRHFRGKKASKMPKWFSMCSPRCPLTAIEVHTARARCCNPQNQSMGTVLSTSLRVRTCQCFSRKCDNFSFDNNLETIKHIRTYCIFFHLPPLIVEHKISSRQPCNTSSPSERL